MLTRDDWERVRACIRSRMATLRVELGRPHVTQAERDGLSAELSRLWVLYDKTFKEKT